MKFIEPVTDCSRKEILDNTSSGEPGHIISTSLCLCCGLLPFIVQATVRIPLGFGLGASLFCCSAKAGNVEWYPSFAKAVDRISVDQAKAKAAHP